MKLCRYIERDSDPFPRVGLLAAGGTALLDLTPAGVTRLDTLLESENLRRDLKKFARLKLPRRPLAKVKLLAPVDQQEVWAAGVTYLRSRNARMDESDFSASAYDRVYVAPRPEIFFKASAHKVVGPDDLVGIRRDARWSVPEPELALVLNSRGKIVGYTIGNDMSSRDIEGENVLYLPQAKIYDRSCALGPWITVGASEQEARRWSIQLSLTRGKRVVFAGKTAVANLKRRFAELCDYLGRSQTFPHGVVLLTGTGLVPPDSFTLRRCDRVRITISGIGVLENSVTVV